MNKCSHCCTIMLEEKGSQVTGNSITVDHDSVINLGTALSEKLQINDEKRIDNLNDPVQIHVQNLCVEEDEEEEEDDDDFSEEELLAQMGYARKKRKPQRRNWNEEVMGTSGCPQDELPRHKPVTTSMEDLNLVSVLKGSREKQGNPAKGCRVSWAPDVYDPPPSAEHIAQIAFDRHENEPKVRVVAAGKKRNKNSPGKSGGSGGKGSKVRGRAAGRDKKQGSWQWQQ